MERIVFLLLLVNKDIEVSLLFLFKSFSGCSDSLLTEKVIHCKSSSSVVVRFFNSKWRSFLTFPFLMPVSRTCKNLIFEKRASCRQSSSLLRAFCLTDISLTKWSIYDSFWVYEAFSEYMNFQWRSTLNLVFCSEISVFQLTMKFLAQDDLLDNYVNCY